MMLTRHLTADELVSALDRLPDARAARHLETCAICRAALAEIEAAQAGIADASEVPEPSPLFWEHLSARVRAETDSAPIPRPSIWWRPLTAVAALSAVVLVLLVSRTFVTRTPVPAEFNDEASWNAMADIASTLSPDDVELVVASAPESAVAVNDLTPREREAFVRLLDGEMGAVQ